MCLVPSSRPIHYTRMLLAEFTWKFGLLTKGTEKVSQAQIRTKQVLFLDIYQGELDFILTTFAIYTNIYKYIYIYKSGYIDFRKRSFVVFSQIYIYIFPVSVESTEKDASPCQTHTWNRVLHPTASNLWPPLFSKSTSGVESLVGFSQSAIL